MTKKSNIGLYNRKHIIGVDPFSDEDFEELIMWAFLEKHHGDDEETPIPHFNASRGFIYDFKKIMASLLANAILKEGQTTKPMISILSRT